MGILKRTFKRRDNTDLFTVGNDSLNGGRIMMQVRERKLCSHKNLTTNIYSNLVHNNPKLEATLISFDEWMVKQIWLHSHLGLLLSKKGTDY